MHGRGSDFLFWQMSVWQHLADCRESMQRILLSVHGTNMADITLNGIVLTTMVYMIALGPLRSLRVDEVGGDKEHYQIPSAQRR